MKACGSQEGNKNVLSSPPPPSITITLTSGVTLLHVKLEGTVFCSMTLRHGSCLQRKATWTSVMRFNDGHCERRLKSSHKDSSNAIEEPTSIFQGQCTPQKKKKEKKNDASLSLPPSQPLSILSFASSVANLSEPHPLIRAHLRIGHCASGWLAWLDGLWRPDRRLTVRAHSWRQGWVVTLRSVMCRHRRNELWKEYLHVRLFKRKKT